MKQNRSKDALTPHLRLRPSLSSPVLCPHLRLQPSAPSSYSTRFPTGSTLLAVLLTSDDPLSLFCLSNLIPSQGHLFCLTSVPANLVSLSFWLIPLHHDPRSHRYPCLLPSLLPAPSFSLFFLSPSPSLLSLLYSVETSSVLPRPIACLRLPGRLPGRLLFPSFPGCFSSLSKAFLIFWGMEKKGNLHCVF